MLLMWPTSRKINSVTGLLDYPQTTTATTPTQYSSFPAIGGISGQSRVFLSHRDGQLMDE